MFQMCHIQMKFKLDLFVLKEVIELEIKYCQLEEKNKFYGLYKLFIKS
jgi:hypothetical protein